MQQITIGKNIKSNNNIQILFMQKHLFQNAKNIINHGLAPFLVFFNNSKILWCLGVSKIFWPYLLPCFLLVKCKKIVFKTSNLFLTFQINWTFIFLQWHPSNLPLVFQKKLYHIIWIWKKSQKYPQKLC